MSTSSTPPITASTILPWPSPWPAGIPPSVAFPLSASRLRLGGSRRAVAVHPPLPDHPLAGYRLYLHRSARYLHACSRQRDALLLAPLLDHRRLRLRLGGSRHPVAHHHRQPLRLGGSRCRLMPCHRLLHCRLGDNRHRPRLPYLRPLLLLRRHCAFARRISVEGQALPPLADFAAKMTLPSANAPSLTPPLSLRLLLRSPLLSHTLRLSLMRPLMPGLPMMVVLALATLPRRIRPRLLLRHLSSCGVPTTRTTPLTMRHIARSTPVCLRRRRRLLCWLSRLPPPRRPASLSPSAALPAPASMAPAAAAKVATPSSDVISPTAVLPASPVLGVDDDAEPPTPFTDARPPPAAFGSEQSSAADASWPQPPTPNASLPLSSPPLPRTAPPSSRYLTPFPAFEYSRLGLTTAPRAPRRGSFPALC